MAPVGLPFCEPSPKSTPSIATDSSRPYLTSPKSPSELSMFHLWCWYMFDTLKPLPRNVAVKGVADFLRCSPIGSQPWPLFQ